MCRLNSGEPTFLRGVRKKASVYRVRCKLTQFIAGKSLFTVGKPILVGEIGAKESRVVGVERDEQACIEVAPQRMVPERGADAGADV